MYPVLVHIIKFVPLTLFLSFLLTFSIFDHKFEVKSMDFKQKRQVLVLNTWFVPLATRKAFEVLSSLNSSMDAIEAGCSVAESEQAMGTVGFGGSPNEKGETTLDAMIMNGNSFEVGVVANLKRVKNAISVARSVIKYSKHTMLVGEDAKQFAIEMGFKEEDLHTNASIDMWNQWLRNNCQPNFRQNVIPDPSKHCGPYKPLQELEQDLSRSNLNFTSRNHDTIGMIAIDATGVIAAGTSTNGLRNKIPGRVGDSPIPGAGAYADSSVGAAAATGDGDTLMRFLPSYQTVENMRNGMDPMAATKNAIARITKHYKDFNGAIVASNFKGEIGAACHGFSEFQYSFQHSGMKTLLTKKMTCSH